MSSLKQIVQPFYTKCLTVNEDGLENATQIIEKLLADSFESINVTETKPKAKMLVQIPYFWKLIPNLKWEIQEMLQDGNKVIVRSIATGNPNGNFMGIECDGSKAFKIMTIDIHTIENNQVVRVHHLEEWTAAIKQLKQ